MGKNTTNDMTQGNCMRLLVQFFLPILAGNLFQQLYSFADHWFRNWTDRRIGNLYFSVFWKWQL